MECGRLGLPGLTSCGVSLSSQEADQSSDSPALRYPEERREMYLSDEELERLFEVLDGYRVEYYSI